MAVEIVAVAQPEGAVKKPPPLASAVLSLLQLRASGALQIAACRSSSGASAGVVLQRLLPFVQLNSERARQVVRQDGPFVKKQESRPALVVVRSGRELGRRLGVARVVRHERSPGATHRD